MARARDLSAALALVAALACAKGDAVPAALIGRWTTDDPRYADRSLEIDLEQIRFGVGPGLQLGYRVRGVESQTDPSAGTLYQLFYDAPGEPERTLQLRLPAPDRLRLENHSELWTRAGASLGGG
ncbi:MAG: hypothetical protein ACREI8_14760 [Myxococcota bacterium]